MIIQIYTVMMLALVCLSVIQTMDNRLLCRRYLIGTLMWIPIIGRVMEWW